MIGTRLQFLSLGAGVQSTTVLLMSCKGDLPKLDGAVFADTGWESRQTYAHLDWLCREAHKHGIPLHRVGRGTIRSDALFAQVRGVKTDGVRWGSMPYFTAGPNGERGIISRQCTTEYKIVPIHRKLRELAGIRPRQRIKTPVVDLWIGISLDEAGRMRDSRDRWIVNHYPLIEKRMNRGDCYEWLKRHRYPRPPRSSCLGCPFHSTTEWRAIRVDPTAWRDVTEFDQAIRKCGGMRGDVYLHPARMPLADVDLSTPEDQGQLTLWDQECEGHCGV